MKSFLCIMSALFFCIQGYSQKPAPGSSRMMGLIIGNVLDAGTSKPLSFASIQLKKMLKRQVSYPKIRVLLT